VDLLKRGEFNPKSDTLALIASPEFVGRRRLKLLARRGW
jgi:hypothetical protein